MIDQDKLLNRANVNLFNKKMTASQKQGIVAIVNEWNTQSFVDNRWLAYILATAYHETATTMQPIKEYGGNAYLTKNYDIKGSNPSRAKANGNTTPGDGIKYCGKGYVQLTWKSNYIKFGKFIGIDLGASPDLAMNSNIAAKIILIGMTNPKCNFTGVVLSNFINAKTTNYVNARKIVNGKDKASLIATYAIRFNYALS